MFKWMKKKQQESYCKHKWEVLDIRFAVRIHTGDTEILYIIGCEGCKRTRQLDEYEYSVMVRKGFLKEKETKNNETK